MVLLEKLIYTTLLLQTAAFAPKTLFNSQATNKKSSAKNDLGGNHSNGALWMTSRSTTEKNLDEKTKWKPKISNFDDRRQLRERAYNQEKIGTIGFHHIEFVCGDAKSMATQFSLSLGMPLTCMTGQSTGNDKCVSYGLQSGNVRFLMTAPYSQAATQIQNTEAKEDSEGDAPQPLPSFDGAKYHDYFRQHGLSGVAIGLSVKDAQKAYDVAVANGARPVLEPTYVPACKSIKDRMKDDESKFGCHMAEVELYGDVVLRFISFESEVYLQPLDQGMEKASVMSILPHMKPIHNDNDHASRKTFSTYGLERIDHAVGNVPNLFEALAYVQKLTGFHEFAEFTPEDVGTVDSGLNSVVLASDSEYVLLPLNEPTEGRRKSQIQTFLEQNEGAGLQHLALKTNDIFSTIRKMKFAEEEMGIGFELMKRPSDRYYQDLPDRLGDKLSSDQYAQLEELGLLADADEEGVLLQVFTKPIGDRPTFFIEIIQRVGCQYTPKEDSTKIMEKAGCGGFGKGNFKELFKAIEEHERTLKV